MATEIKHWTLEDVHGLPEDGNTYELVYGELFVTPAPTDRHETIAARLARILDRYVEFQQLGYVYRPKAVFRIERDVEVEPDLMVRQPHPDPAGSWETAPRPILVVEILSPSTRRDDFGRKRQLYIDDARLDEYWIVDGDACTITVARPGHDLVAVSDVLTWAPTAASAPLTFELTRVFG